MTLVEKPAVDLSTGLQSPALASLDAISNRRYRAEHREIMS